MLTIYGRANSSNVRKVLWLCHEIDLNYDRLDYGRGFKDGKSPEHLALNPNGYVPTIVDDEFVLWESNSIVRYLAGKHGREDLLGADLQSRALVEQWMDWQLATLGPRISPIFQYQVVGSQKFASPDVQAEAAKDANNLMGILDSQLGRTTAYVAGSTLTCADFPIGMFTHRWLSLDIDRPDYQNVKSYYALLNERQPFKDGIIAGGI